MLCEKCGKNNATVRSKVIINGLVTEKSFCASCWEEENEQFFGQFSFSDLLKGFVQQPVSAPALTCKTCGMDIRTFRQGGLLGCQGCYETFAQALEPMLKKIHGKAIHEGKQPHSAADCGLPTENELDALKLKLAEAVDKEEYESAAVYRDRIKELTKEGA